MSIIRLKSLTSKLILATGVAIAGVMVVSNTYLIYQTRERVHDLTMQRAEAEAYAAEHGTVVEPLPLGS